MATALLLALLACGCGSVRPTGDSASDGTGEFAPGEQLSLRDPRRGNEGGADYLEVTVSNPGAARIQTRCAPEWYDARGAVVDAPIAWRDLDLPPGQDTRLRFAPMPTAARSWRLRFRS